MQSFYFLSWKIKDFPNNIVYMGLVIPGERLLPKLPKVGLVVGWVGSDLGFGAGLPLKALMLKDNFAQGCSEAKELSLEFGFKLII